MRCPFEYGILDGLLLLLRELVPQVDMPVAQLYIETGIWGSMWHRVAQALQVSTVGFDTWPSGSACGTAWRGPSSEYCRLWYMAIWGSMWHHVCRPSR